MMTRDDVETLDAFDILQGGYVAEPQTEPEVSQNIATEENYYSKIKKFEEKWGDVAGTSIESTIEKLVPELLKQDIYAPLIPDMSEEFSREKLNPMYKESNVDYLNFEDFAFSRLNPKNQELLKDFIELTDTFLPKDKFSEVVNQVQGSTLLPIDPQKLKMTLRRMYETDETALLNEDNNHWLITQAITHGVYSIFGSLGIVWQGLNSGETGVRQYLRKIGEQLQDYGLDAGGLVAGGLVAGTTGVLTTRGVSSLIGGVLEAIGTSAVAGESLLIGVSPLLAGVSASILAGGYALRYYNAFSEQVKRRYKEPRILDVLYDGRVVPFTEALKNVETPTFQTFIQDAKLYGEFAVLGSVLGAIFGGGRYIRRRFTAKDLDTFFKKTPDFPQGIDENPKSMDLERTAQHEALKGLAQSGAEPITNLPTDSIVSILHENRDNLGNLITKTPDSEVLEALKRDVLEDLPAETLKNVNKARNLSLEIYNLDNLEDAQNLPTFKRALLKTTADFLSYRQEESIESRKGKFKEIADLIRQDDLFTNSEIIKRVYTQLADLIPLPEENISAISERMKMATIAEFAQKHAFSIEENIPFSFKSTLSQDYEKRSFLDIYHRFFLRNVATELKRFRDYGVDGLDPSIISTRDTEIAKIIKQLRDLKKFRDKETKLTKELSRNGVFSLSQKEFFEKNRLQIETFYKEIEASITNIHEMLSPNEERLSVLPNVDLQNFKERVRLRQEKLKSKTGSYSGIKDQLTEFMDMYEPRTNTSDLSRLRKSFTKVYNLFATSLKRQETPMLRLSLDLKDKLNKFIKTSNIGLTQNDVFSRLVMELETNSDWFSEFFDNYPEERKILDLENLATLRAKTKELVHQYNLGYRKMLQIVDPFGDPARRTLDFYYPQDLNLTYLKGLQLKGSLEPFLNHFLDALDIPKTTKLRDDGTRAEIRSVLGQRSAIKQDIQLSKEILLKEMYSKYGEKEIYPKMVEELFSTMDLPDQISLEKLNKIVSLLYDRNFTIPITKPVLKNIWTDILNDESYNLKTESSRLTRKHGVLSLQGGTSDIDLHRVFIYKSYGHVVDLAQKYGNFDQALNAWVAKNRRNIKVSLFRELIGDLDLNPQLIDAIIPRIDPLGQGEQNILKDIGRGYSRFQIKAIIDALSKPPELDIGGSANLYSRAVISWFRTISNISKLGGLPLTIAATDPINMVINGSELGIKIPYLLRKIGKDLYASMTEGSRKLSKGDFQDFIEILHTSDRYSTNIDLYTAPQESRLRKAVTQSIKKSETLAQYFFLGNLSSPFTERLLKTSKEVVKEKLWLEMGRGEYGVAWKRIEKYGSTPETFKFMKSVHNDSLEFLENLYGYTKHGKIFSAAIELLTREMVTHTTPITKLMLASFAPTQLIFYTLFYLQETLIQETLNKVVYPILEKHYSKLMYHMVGDMISAMLLKIMKSHVSGYTPQLDRLDFYKDLAKEMPAFSLVNNWIDNGTMKLGGIFKPVIDLAGLDIVKFIQDVSPLSTIPYLRVLQERMVLDKLYHMINPQHYRQRVGSRKAWNRQRGREAW